MTNLVSKHIILLAALCSLSSAFVQRPTACSHKNNIFDSSSVAVSALPVDPNYLIAAGAAISAVGGAAIAYVKGSRGKDKATVGTFTDIKTELIDVSVPYDATASLAFDAYLKSASPSKTIVDFEEFRNLYYSQMVAEVKIKVQERKINEMNAILSDLKNEASDANNQLIALFDKSE